MAEATTNHGLPPNATPSGTLPVSQAVMRGRARALPFYRKHPEDRTPPPPGAVFFMDMAGPLLPGPLLPATQLPAWLVGATSPPSGGTPAGGRPETRAGEQSESARAEAV